jgi:hypothetical protein
MDVELYADPSCPWSWAAYVWLDRVAPQRQLRLVLRPFSLALRDGTSHLPSVKRRIRHEAHRALRVAAAIDDDAVRWTFFGAVAGPAYAAVAAGEAPRFDVDVAAASAGVGAAAAVAGDPALDEAIAEHMRSASTHLPEGGDGQPRVPLLVTGSTQRRTALLGPLLDPPPAGQQAVRLWDAVETVARVPGLHEISRPQVASRRLLGAPAPAVRETR